MEVPKTPLNVTDEERQKIKKPEWLDPEFRELSLEETKEARQEIVYKYPRIARGMVLDPYPGQEIGLISFQFFENHEVKANNLHGFFRLDVQVPNEDQATKRSNQVIRYQDSYHKMLQCPRGVWIPISDHPAWSREHQDADIGEKGRTLRDEASLAKQKEDARKVREIEERRRLIEKETQEIEELGLENTLDYFVTFSNKIRLLASEISDREKNIQKLKEKLEEHRSERQRIGAKHPEWMEQISVTYKEKNGSKEELIVPVWMDRFNSMREQTGLPAFTEEDFWDLNKIKS